jgi:hypothetical protein
MIVNACASRLQSDSREVDEPAIRAADAPSLRAIAAKHVDATVSYYDEQASILMPNAPIVRGQGTNPQGLGADVRNTWIPPCAEHDQDRDRPFR